MEHNKTGRYFISGSIFRSPFFLLASLVFVIGLSFCVQANAQEISYSSPGQTQGSGTFFEIQGSDFLNISLDSSQSADINLISASGMIQLVISPDDDTTSSSTDLTITGLASNTTYYKYENNLHSLAIFTSDQSGAYTYTQDLSQLHLIFIRLHPSTFFISNNATGGDCQTIGIWEALIKTCTLTTNVQDTIEIDSSGITINGNGHSIGDFGIFSFFGSNLAIKNITTASPYPIYIANGSNNLIENNTFHNSVYSIRAVGGSLLTIRNNFIQSGTILGFGDAMLISGVTNVSVFKNTINGNFDACLNIQSGSSGQVYNNNVVGCVRQIMPSILTLNLPLPVGGNFWGNFNTPAQGCNDVNNDGFCDAPYVIFIPPSYTNQDNLPWTRQNGWLPPIQTPSIASGTLLQYKSDATTPIAEGATTAEGMVIFSATLNSSSTNPLRLEVEYTSSTIFSGTANATSSSVSPGNNVTITKNLFNGSYRWRARAVDTVTNVTSAWQEFGTTGNTDFVVNNLGQAAADLAKQLVNSVYLIGGKGWDYNSSQFVTPNIVTSSYTYWNQAINAISTGAGVDCSGLIMWAFDRSVNPNVSWKHNFVKAENADEQYRYNTTPISEAQLKPGDVMFFDNVDANGNPGQDGYIDHVEMFVGDSGGYDIVSAASKVLGIITRVKDIRKVPSTGFLGPDLGFKRVIPATPLAMITTSYSPVDLMVTDPDGYTITPTTVVSSSEELIRAIPGELYYFELEKGDDGLPIDQVYSYTQKSGDYLIKVMPVSGTSPTATYSLDFQTGNQSTTLAQNVPISQIPSQGYGVTASTSGTVSTFMPVVINIKPNSYPNPINLGSNGVVPVAIFGSATFDVHQINPASITLANALIKLKGNGQPQIVFSDINGDGFTDLTVNVLTNALQLTSSSVKATLDGFLLDGTEFKGSNSIMVVPQ